MRILVLVHEFPPIGGGGGRVAEDVCRELTRRGHEIKVLTAHMKGLPYRDDQEGFEVIRLRSARQQSYRASFLSMAAFILSGFWASLWLLKKWRPDVIHVHFAVPAGALAWILFRLTGIPYLLTSHLGDVPGGVPEKTRKWFRLVYPFTPSIWKDASRVVVVSRYTRELAEQLYPVAMDVIPNGIDLNLGDQSELVIHTPPRIMFAGRFMPQKNPLQIVRALSKLTDLEWECVMLGDGPLFEQVKASIASYKLEERFTLPGWVTPQDVIDWFGKGDVLFMPSLSEGLPVVGVQALVKGLAITASRIGGFMDLVEEGENGYLFPHDDEAAMVNTLRTLLTDHDKLLRARRRSRELVGRFDIISTVNAYEKILKEMVQP